MKKVLALPLLLLLAACSADSTRHDDRRPRHRVRVSGGRARRRRSTTITARVSRIRIAGSSSVDDAQTRQWISAENALAQPYLEGIPARETIKKRLTELWNYERYDIPVQRGGRYFYPAQRRLAEPERAVRGGRPAGAAARAARSEHAEQGRDDRAGRVRAEPGRQACSRTACPTAAPTGAPGISATWRPARDLPDVLRFIKFAHGRLDRRFAHASTTRAIPLRADGSGDDTQAARGLLAQAGHRAGRGRARVQGRRPSDAQSVRADLRRRPLPDHLAVRRLAADRHLLPHARRRTARRPAKSCGCSTRSTRDYEFVAEIDDTFYVRTNADAPNCAADRRAGDVGRAQELARRDSGERSTR